MHEAQYWEVCPKAAVKVSLMSKEGGRQAQGLWGFAQCCLLQAGNISLPVHTFL